eukprot:jgi/Chrzof1/2723/Cz11g26170.t1
MAFALKHNSLVKASAPIRASRVKLAVQARATATTKSKVEKKMSGLAVLLKIEELGLLSKVEQLGLLSKLEQSGLTLSKIEESGLLSQLEKSGALKMVADENTPTALSLTGWTLLAAAAALVYFIPDDSTGLIAAQVAGASVLGGAAVAALVGAGFLSQLQKA